MDAAKRTRLIQLLGMMGSAHDGEKLNAARLAMRLIGEEGLTWEEVFKGIPGSSNSGGDQRYRDGYSEGYRKGLAEGHARGATMTRPHPPTWTAFSRTLLADYEDDLSDWEQGFLENYVSRGWSTPTPKQRDVFIRIANKLDLECPS